MAQALRSLHLSRDQIAKITQGDPQATRTIEALVSAVDAMLAAGGFVARATLVDAIVAVAAIGNPVGARTTITDSFATTTAGIGTVITGGGVEVVPAYYDGADWRIG